MGILKRAFTKDGKSISSVRDEYGALDAVGKYALAVRLVIFIPVVIATIGLLLTQFTDVTFKEYINAILQVKDALM